MKTLSRLIVRLCWNTAEHCIVSENKVQAVGDTKDKKQAITKNWMQLGIHKQGLLK